MTKAARSSLPAERSSPAAMVRNVVPRVLLAVAAAFALPGTAGAQAWAYPSFQPPRVMDREFNFGVADAGRAGTSLVFQWREGLSQRSQISFDLGFADPDGEGNGKLLLGGQFAGMLADPKAEMPLAFLGTVGINMALGGGSNLVRIPVGVSIGHRFALDEPFAITPYVHPRVSLDLCSDCGGRDNQDGETDLGVDFDLGVNFEVTRQLSFRASVVFGGSDTFGDSDGFGISLAWTPPGLSKLIRR
jgi:hypothetical protein